MAQVVTNENFAQLVQTGSVPEFVPPVAAEPASTTENKAAETTDSVDKASEKGNITDASKGESDDDDTGLTEKVRQKIGAKHRQMREAEELTEVVLTQRDEATRRAEQAEARLRELEAKSRPAAEPEKEPEPKDFATVQDYRDALRTFLREQERANVAREREEAAQQEQARQHYERLAKAREKYPDFDKSLRTLETVTINNDVIAFIQESELGPELLYDLAKDPKEMDRLRKLSPRKAIAELAKRELKLEQPAGKPAAPKEAPVNVSQAPAPIAPLDGKSSTVQKDPAKMNFQELREYRRQEEANKRRR